MKKRKWLSSGLLVAMLVSTASPINSFAAEEVQTQESTDVTEEVVLADSIQINLNNASYSTKEFKATIAFPEEADFDLISTNNIHVRNKDLGDDQTADVGIRLTKDEKTRTVVVTLKEGLDQNAFYQIIVDDVYDLEGETLDTVKKSFRSGEQVIEEVTELKAVTNLKGKAVSPSSIKFTWSYDKVEEKNIDGFNVYDEEGDLLTEVNDVNAKDREYVLIGLKPDKTYSITIKAFKIVDTEGEDDLESEGVTAEEKTKKLTMPTFSEDNLIANVNGKDIQYYWSYKNYQDYAENFTDYELQIADDKKFTKNVKKIPLAKGQYLHKNAIKKLSSKNSLKLTKYFRIVNKANDIKSAATQKTIIVKKVSLPKAPKLVVGDVQDYSVTVLITDNSTNEESFNLYYIDINGNKTLYTTVQSKDSKGTGDVTSVDVYWLTKGEFHGFIATAVDKNGLEGKESTRVVVSEPAEDVVE